MPIHVLTSKAFAEALARIRSHNLRILPRPGCDQVEDLLNAGVDIIDPLTLRPRGPSYARDITPRKP